MPSNSKGMGELSHWPTIAFLIHMPTVVGKPRQLAKWRSAQT